MSESALQHDEVTTRVIPATRWPAIAWLVFALVAAGVAAWEWKMRTLGLVAGDLDDSKSHWAVERRRLAAGDHDDVVLIGSSRMLFDTDLSAWEEVTGRRPIQLALAGTNPRPHLKDLADNSDFAGLIVIDMTPDLFFTDWPGIPEFAGLTEYWKDESPSKRFGHLVGLELERHFAFLDGSYRLGTLIDRLPVRDREGVRGPLRDVWKLWQTSDDRQTSLWPRIETDEWLRDHARWVWGPFTGEPVEQELIDRVIEDVRLDIEKIRARGGEVAIVRCPSAGLYYESEEWSAPRAKTWDPLIAKTGAIGVHFEDYPQMQGLDVPEWSHVSQADSAIFTRAYVQALADELPWLVRSPPAEAAP
jgi:hypothetical protein